MHLAVDGGRVNHLLKIAFNCGLPPYSFYSYKDAINYRVKLWTVILLTASTSRRFVRPVIFGDIIMLKEDDIRKSTHMIILQYKPPADVTRRTALNTIIRCSQPRKEQKNETKAFNNKTAKNSSFHDACFENRPVLHRTVQFFQKIKQLKTKQLWHSNNGWEVKHTPMIQCAAFTAD